MKREIWYTFVVYIVVGALLVGIAFDLALGN